MSFDTKNHDRIYHFHLLHKLSSFFFAATDIGRKSRRGKKAHWMSEEEVFVTD